MKRTRSAGRERRHRRVRKKIQGSPERGRLCVFRSNLHIYAQIIDDTRGVVLASASSLKLGEVDRQEGATLGMAKARAVGQAIAAAAKEKGIQKVTFDRGGYKYHGRVKALASAAREGGLEF